MNDVDMLTAAVETDPANSIVAAMLLDELIASRDMTYTEAELHVIHVQLVAQAAANLRKATHIYASNKRAKRELHAVIRAMVDTGAASRFTVLIVPGRSEPSGAWNRVTTEARYWAQLTVTVGADYLLECDWFGSR